MTAKDFLKQYKQYDKDIAYLKQQIEWAEENATCIRSVTDYDGMPHGANIGHPTEDAAIKIADLKIKWSSLRTEKVLKRLQIVDLICRLPSPEREIIHYRYIDGCSWEQICVLIAYEWTQTHEYHKRGLKAVQSILDATPNITE